MKEREGQEGPIAPKCGSTYQILNYLLNICSVLLL